MLDLHLSPRALAMHLTAILTDRSPLARTAAAGLLAFLPFVSGCGSRGPERADAEVPALEVRTFRPASPAEGTTLVFPARVKADEEVTLTARVPGRLTALPLLEGARFRRGDSLAVFDSPEAREALAAARSGLAAATARRDRARVQEARLDSLYASSVVSKSDLELAQVDRQAAEAAYASAQATLAQWQEGTRLPAPFDGVVVRRRADAGQMLQPGSPVLDLRSARAHEALAAVPESELETLPAARASVQVGDGPWQPVRLARVEGMTDPATRTRIAHFALIEPGPPLDPGAFARVRLEGVTAPDSVPGPGPLSVPASSLVRRGALTGVYVIVDGRAHLRWLRLGRIDDDRAEVLAGLWPTDEVALDAAPLADGRPVRVVR